MAKQGPPRQRSEIQHDAASHPSPYADQELKALRLFEAGAFQEAERICRNLLQINQISVGVYTCLAGICSRTNRTDEGIAYLNQANAIWTNHPDILANLGMLLHRKGDLDTAYDAFQKALSLQPDHPNALVNMGTTCMKKGELDEAIRCYQKVLVPWPDHPEILYNLALAYQERGNLDLAIKTYQQAISLRPDHAESHCNLGNALRKCGDYEGAIQTFSTALSINPNDPIAHHGSGLILLGQENYKQGWEEYEWRSKVCISNEDQELSTRPIWKPQLAADRLLLWPEQGIGDLLLFYTMLNDARALARHLIVQSDLRLVPLLKRSMPGIEFIPSDKQIPETDYDAQLLIGSLGQYLRRSASDFPVPRSSYLISDPHRTRELRRSLSPGDHRLIGISWRSFSSRPTRNSHDDLCTAKSIPLAALAPVLAQEGVRLVSLQYGDVEAEIRALRDSTGIELQHCEDVDPLNDLDGLAALISACDLVITSSNTTAHLAGALGAPAWVLLPMVPFWYWGIDAETTPWYASLRLFRQRQRGHWTELLEQVKQQLLSHLA